MALMPVRLKPSGPARAAARRPGFGRGLHAGRRLALACLTLLASGAASAQTGSPCQVRNPDLQGRYVGDCQGGLANGQGRASGTDRYEGGFRDGHASGEGLYTWTNGQRVQGQFQNGRLNGRARFTYPNGDTLEGEFRDNRLVGTGQAQRRDGTPYAVELRNGVLTLVTATATATPGPAPGGAAAPQAGVAGWSPRLDFEDFFPSFILASATRSAPADGAQRGIDNPRGDPLAMADSAQLLKALGHAGPADTVNARYLGQGSDTRYLGDPWGLVGIKLHNSTPGARVTVQVSIDEIAEPTEASFTLPEVGSYALYPKMRYRYDRLRNMLQPVPVNVSWRVSRDGQVAETRSAVARVRTVQDAPLAVVTERGRENMAWVFAGYVTEDAAWIDDLLKEAFAGTGQRPVGYQVGPEGVDRQVEAIYNHLRKRGLSYSSITTSSGKADKVSSQIVRFPSDSIRTAQANCIDGTVLLASILRKIGIEPIIVTGPGHAILGYFRQDPRKDQEPDVAAVETTLLGHAGFAEARQAGIAQFKKWISENAGHPQFNIIEVARMRERGVMPIPR